MCTVGRAYVPKRWLSMLLGTIVVACMLACGSEASAPPAVSLLLTADTSHPCAGATRMKITIDEIGGDPLENEVATAIAPEQLDCDFSVGVAEALYSLLVGEINTDKAHTAKVELFDSTQLSVSLGASEPFQPTPTKRIDPIEIKLTRVAMLGTALVDLMAEPDFASASGTLTISLASSPGLGSRQLDWPGTAAEKRPLRISGLQGFGLQLDLEVKDATGNSLASATTEAFTVGLSESEAFVSPALQPR